MQSGGHRVGNSDLRRGGLSHKIILAIWYKLYYYISTEREKEETMSVFITQTTYTVPCEMEEFDTFDETLNTIKEYVQDDKREGVYGPNFYEIKEIRDNGDVEYYDEEGNVK